MAAEIRDRDGNRCVWPECVTPTDMVQVAHFQHRGMGGSLTRNIATNGACLCQFHHRVVLDGDGGHVPKRRREVVALLVAYLRAQGADVAVAP